MSRFSVKAPRTNWKPLLCGLLASLLVACGDPMPPADSTLQLRAAAALPPASEQTLEVQFLGAGGVYLRQDGQALLGDPFFSNPPLRDWLPWRSLQVRPEVIDAHLPPLDAVQGVLVGHVHFDHALDVPHVAGRLPASVKVYGSETLPNLLATFLPPERLVNLSPRMTKAGQGGEWQYLNPQLRVLPIQSGHAPHLGSTVLASEQVTQPPARPPASALDWQSGTNLNYVIDFLDDGQPENAKQVRFRIFYQSSASSAPTGFPPRWLLDDGVPFDLALLCAANFDHVSDYPEQILQQIRPRQVMLIHWERFWDEYDTNTARPLPGLDFAGLEQRIRSVLDDSVPVWLPQRTAHIQLRHTP